VPLLDEHDTPWWEHAGLPDPWQDVLVPELPAELADAPDSVDEPCACAHIRVKTDETCTADSRRSGRTIDVRCSEAPAIDLSSRSCSAVRSAAVSNTHSSW
jgi:hypothetical protein